MTIKEIRSTIESANWNRRDSTGGTPEENLRRDLRAELLPWVAKLESLEIPARFARDIADRAHAISAIHTVIERQDARKNTAAFHAKFTGIDADGFACYSNVTLF